MGEKYILLDERQLCDLELLLVGGFFPLSGFMGKNDYESVLENKCLRSGELFPLPIVLGVKESLINFGVGEIVELKDYTYNTVAVINVNEIFEPDLDKEVMKIWGSEVGSNHSYINYLRNKVGCDKLFYISGKVERANKGIKIKHWDFRDLRKTPSELKKVWEESGYDCVIGFQTRNPMHRCHYELTKLAVNEAKEQGYKNIALLIHPVVGVTQESDVPYWVRIKCYKKLLKHYEEMDGVDVHLSVLPLSMRMAGPREAMWHSLIRRNYGCTHFIVGRDHAGPSCKRENGESFFGPYDAHKLLEENSSKLGIRIIKSQIISYDVSRKNYYPIGMIKQDDARFISGSELRRKLRNKEEIEEWFSWDDIIEELRNYYGSCNKGVCIYLVGLSGAGKTTISEALQCRLHEIDSSITVSLLDGDEVRRNLSKGLGFSKEDRMTNITRIGYVASQIVKHGGVAIAANIAPYKEARDINRNMIEKYGKYVQVYVNTKLDTCIFRDPKGLYKKALKSEIKSFTGISDPFEEPTEDECELIINGDEDVLENVDKIIKVVLGYQMR